MDISNPFTGRNQKWRGFYEKECATFGVAVKGVLMNMKRTNFRIVALWLLVVLTLAAEFAIDPESGKITATPYPVEVQAIQ